MSIGLIASICVGCTPACNINVSGLPPYMCVGQSALVSATTSPSAFQNNVSWTRNSRLYVSPGTGSTRLARALSPGAGSVTGSLNTDSCSDSDQDTVPIFADKASDYSQVASTATCPERAQDTAVDHVIDGCSVPPSLLTVVDYILGPVIDFSDDVNDPVGGVLAIADTRFGQPEAPVPHGQNSIDLPCNKHDVCYQSCGQAKLGCDNHMDADMETVCDAAYPDDCPWTSATTCAAYVVRKALCYAAQWNYFTGVRIGGNAAYQSRQVQYCSCCAGG